MEKILDLQLSKDHYIADVCVAWCFDDRFTSLMNEFLKQFPHSDVVKIAGGAKALAGGASPERDFVLGQIQASIRLHATKEIVLMVHMDCGAYGGSKVFDNDEAKEQAHHTEELVKARDFLAQQIPGVPVRCVIADFGGIYRI